VHHLGFGFHADACAPGILALLEPVRERDGLVLELGCGSGLLTRYLVDAGHRVIATDASPAMLELTKRNVPEAEDIRQLVLPDDPIPEADAIVSIGHVLSYLDDEPALDRALVAAARAVRLRGVLALDLCDLEWGEARPDDDTVSWVTDDWVLVTRTSLPSSSRYVREMTIFVRTGEETWRRDDERHDNVLIDTSAVPGALKEHGLETEVRSAFGEERLPTGLVAIVGHRPG
jgi:SAM-dependent methyltransferase